MALFMLDIQSGERIPLRSPNSSFGGCLAEASIDASAFLFVLNYFCKLRADDVEVAHFS